MYNFDVIVIGAGPAGIFTALELDKQAPDKKILVVDSGSSINQRSCPARKIGRCINCKPCNITSTSKRTCRFLA